MVCQFWHAPLSLGTVSITLHIPRHNCVFHINLQFNLAAGPYQVPEHFICNIMCPDVANLFERCSRQKSGHCPDFHTCGLCYSQTRQSKRAEQQNLGRKEDLWGTLLCHCEILDVAVVAE